MCSFVLADKIISTGTSPLITCTIFFLNYSFIVCFLLLLGLEYLFEGDIVGKVRTLFGSRQHFWMH